MGPESRGADTALEASELELESPSSAAALRPPADIKFFFDDPCVHHFFQAVRLLERANPQRKPVGRFARPSDEAVRFEGNATLNLSKLANDRFVDNAPADVVMQERDRAAEFERTIAHLEERLGKLAELD